MRMELDDRPRAQYPASLNEALMQSFFLGFEIELVACNIRFWCGCEQGLHFSFLY